MADSTSNRFVASVADAAARAAFTPSPPTPASGPAQGYTLYQRDTDTLYSWDSAAAAWVAPTAGTVNLATGVTGVLPVANGGTAVSAGFVPLLSVPVSLTDAQIKALPTTPITIVAAPSAGFRIRVHSGSFHLNNTAGAYTNVTAATGNLTIQTADGNFLLAPIANQTSLAIPLTRLTTYLTSAASTLVDLPQYLEAVQESSAGDWGWEQPVVNYPVPGSPQAVVLKMANAAGNLTGGNAANTLKVTLYWTVEPL